MIPILDRRVPSDFKHVTKYPMRLMAERVTVPVEKILDIPRQYRDEYDQGAEGACVGYSQSWMMSILNRKLYDAYRLYSHAQGIDEWPETPPEEGTSLRAGFDVLRTIGHWRVYGGKTRGPILDEGIQENRWATTVNEVRDAIIQGLPVNLGINWYSTFFEPTEHARHDDQPLSKRREYVIGGGTAWGFIAGGHAITVVGVSDTREAFALCNTWGYQFPFLVWLPYRAFERLISESGEAGIVTDRVRT